MKMSLNMFSNLFMFVVACCLASMPLSSAFAFTPLKHAVFNKVSKFGVLRSDMKHKSLMMSQIDDHSEASNAEGTTQCVQRRDMLQQALGLSAGLLVSCTTKPAFAASVDAKKAGENSGLVSASEVVDLLRPIPTFTFVDKKGVPFMVVGEDAKVTGYFFTSFDEAERILKVASSTADKAIAKAKKDDPTEDVGTNPWKDARISSVPLDTAATLAIRSARSPMGGGTYFRVAPSETDVDDALAVTGKETLAEGKVPLFYYADFKTTDKNGMTRSPLYFSQSELENDYRKNNSKTDELPKLMVTELFSVLTEMVKPGGTNNELKELMFMVPVDSDKRKIQCDKKNGKEPPFVLGQRIIVL